jgi:uncharacterized protein YktB (UPF0637 family)
MVALFEHLIQNIPESDRWSNDAMHNSDLETFRISSASELRRISAALHPTKKAAEVTVGRNNTEREDNAETSADASDKMNSIFSRLWPVVR